MNTPVNFSSLASLAEEQPSTLMGCVRMAWPHIRAARDQKVTLKVIHKRLNDAGIPISYKLLAAYVARLQHERVSTARSRRFCVAPKRTSAT